jgi:hypothetical protein
MKLAIVSGKEITQKGKEKLMTRRKKEPLRTLTEEERNWLERISRARSEPAAHVARAKGASWMEELKPP